MFHFRYTIAALLAVYLSNTLSFVRHLPAKFTIRSDNLEHFCRGINVHPFHLNANENNGADNEFYSVKSETQRKVEAKVAQEIEVKQNIEGFLNNDLLSMESGKQVRVTLYIVLAILPCLLLIPFMMDRSFVPADIDPTDMLRK